MKHVNKSSILGTIILILLLFVLLPDIETVKESLNQIRGAELSWVMLGILFYLITILLNAIQIVYLSEIKLKFFLTYKVQWSLQFINKILPASISTLVVNYFYLNKVGHSSSQNISILAMRALTSSLAYVFIAIVAIILALGNFGNIFIDLENIIPGEINILKLGIISIVVLSSVIWILLKVHKTREFLNKKAGSFWSQFKNYNKRRGDVVIAFSSTTLSTFFGILVLLVSAKSLGLEISFVEVFFIFTLGNTLATLVPVPGGIGAAEAGLYAGFTILGYPPTQSMAAVLLYRIISFWLPLIPGIIAFVNLRKDLFSDFTFNTDLIKNKIHRKA